MKLTLTTVCLCAISTAARAQDAIVPDQFPTIQAAANAALDVDADGTIEIFVRAGTYNENVLVQRPHVSITGESASTTIVVGVGGAPTIRVEDSAQVTIASLRVQNDGSADGIEFQRSNGAVVTGVVATQCHTGITVNNGVGGTVSSCTAFGNTSSGIKLGRSTQVAVVGNDCHGNADHGIDLARAISNQLSANVCTSNTGAGIRIARSDKNTLMQNTCTLNQDGARMDSAANNLLAGNTFSQNVQNGLRTNLTTTNSITGNVLNSNGDYGIRRKAWNGDDYSAAPGQQDPIGDNTVVGNGKGAVRED